MASGLRSPRSIWLLACAVLGSGACSYVFVAPPKHEGDGVSYAGDCTTSIVAPVIDTMLTGTNLFTSIYVAGQDNVANKDQALVAGVVATGLWLSSAIYGYYNTSKRRRGLRAAAEIDHLGEEPESVIVRA